MSDHATLTDAEREALLRRTARKMDFHATRDDVLFLLARVAEARAAERERIAQAIEADACGCDLNRDPFDPASSEAEATCDRVMVEAARIAREGADR